LAIFAIIDVAATQMAEKKVQYSIVAGCDAPPVLILQNMFSISWRYGAPITESIWFEMSIKAYISVTL